MWIYPIRLFWRTRLLAHGSNMDTMVNYLKNIIKSRDQHATIEGKVDDCQLVQITLNGFHPSSNMFILGVSTLGTLFLVLFLSIDTILYVDSGALDTWQQTNKLHSNCKNKILHAGGAWW